MAPANTFFIKKNKKILSFENEIGRVPEFRRSFFPPVDRR
jgi:hypothetical protein